MGYKRVTRGLTILVMLIALFFMFTGWVIEGNAQDTVETAVEEQRLVPIYFVEMEDKKLAISFDAAWGCERTEKILGILKKYDVKATFFLTNIWLEDYPDMAKKIADAGHEIAMHSVSHPHMPQLSKKEMQSELDGNSEKITEVTGVTPSLFRFPFGDYDNASMQVLAENGVDAIQWSIDSLDWQESKTAEGIAERVMSGLHPGAIILCHNNGTYTAEAIDTIIPYAQEKGYQFVPVGNLIYKGDYTVNQQGMQEMPEAVVKTENTASEGI